MKIMIEIPEEFICDYVADRFEDCFQRFICDSKAGLMAGNYERETAEMLIKAFKDAKEVIMCKDCRHSDGFGLCPMDFIDPEGFCYKGEPKNTWKKLECGGYECPECGEVVERMTKFCPECGSDKRWRKE